MKEITKLKQNTIDLLGYSENKGFLIEQSNRVYFNVRENGKVA